MTREQANESRALNYAEKLIQRVKAKKLRRSAFERCMWSFLTVAKYKPEHRDRIMDICMARLDGGETT